MNYLLEIISICCFWGYFDQMGLLRDYNWGLIGRVTFEILTVRGELAKEAVFVAYFPPPSSKKVA